MDRWRKWFAPAVMALFVHAVLPPTLIHALVDHEETWSCDTAQPAVSPQHQHCASLQLVMLPMHANEPIVLYCVRYRLGVACFHGYASMHQPFYDAYDGRAPPIMHLI